MSPRILLAGMNRFPNQFSRYLDSKGCETVHISGNPGGHIPTDCEAVIIPKCQISHEKFWKTKDLYKELNKPVFITDFGITPIRERLDAFLSTLPKSQKTKEKQLDTSMSQAFKVAMVDLPTYMKNNEKANKIIEDDFVNNVPIKETVLKLRDLRQADGSPYNIHYVTTLRSKFALKPAPRPAIESRPPTPSPNRERRAEMTQPDKAVDLGDVVLRILNSPGGKDQKATLILKVLERGQVEPAVIIRKTKTGLQFSSVNPITQTEKELITLSQVQAIAILQHLSSVEDYATDPNVG